MELGIRRIIIVRNRIRVHSCSFVADTLWSPQFIQNRREKLKYGFQEKEFQPRMNTNIHEFWRWNWESEGSLYSGIGFVFIRVHSWPTLFGRHSSFRIGVKNSNIDFKKKNFSH